MVDLVPAPNDLNLASPALGPWFRFGGAASGTPPVPPVLPLPGSATLALPVSLVQDMEWRAPANALRSYHVASPTRPAALRGLRRPDGTKAFADGALVVLLTLLPEAELRLWALSQPLAQPDGAAAPAANVPTRPRIRSFAFEIAPGTITTLAALEGLRGADFPSDLGDDAQRAAYLGLGFGAGGFANAAAPTRELLRPQVDREAAIRARSGPLSGDLWCFDHRGRAVDPGAVAAWWAQMATPALWGNLWANSDAADQVTATVAPGRVVHLTSAHEGPLEAGLRARFSLSDLTAIGGTDYLYTAGTAPALGLGTAPDPDTAPLPRLAALPNGAYRPPATATPFAGWTDTTTAFPMARDYLRIGIVDLEAHLVGVTRADAAQADARLRISPQRSTVAPYLATSDAVTAGAMAALAADPAGLAMAPVMDADWGANQPAALTAVAPLPDTLAFSVRGLAGEGSSAGATSAGQRILVEIASADLPAGAWLRIWPHGIDGATGRRFRQDGGGCRIAGSGESYLVLPIPDGAAAAQMSFDAMVVAADGARVYADLPFARPAIVPGARVSLPASPGVPAGLTLWICEQGAPFVRAGGALRSGETVLAVPDDPASGTFALVAGASLAASDYVAATLGNAAGAGDVLITTTPAFGATPEGSLDLATGPNGAGRVHRTRAAFTDTLTLGRPVPSMERLEVVALDRSGNTAVIGATPGRAAFHEAPPAQLGHPGVPAGPEISGPGLALAGPVTDQLVPLMRERQATDLAGFIDLARNPLVPVADPGGTSAWAVVLETLSHGVVGDATVRAYLAGGAGHTPGQAWLDLKADIQARSGVDLDTLLDSTGFTAAQQAALAQAFDAMIARTRDGAAGFARAAQAAIGRAEDFIYIQTPAIDPLTAGSGAIDLIGAIRARWTARPDLAVILCVPEKWLPKRASKIEEIRKAGIGAALKALQGAAKDRVVLFSPIAAPGRPLHLAGSLVVVDDAILLAGSTHLWRRGLTFDSSLAGAVFDEAVSVARPTAVRMARITALAQMLGVEVSLIPDDPNDCLSALTQLTLGAGLGRVKPGAYTPADDPTSAADQAIWNPDGRRGIASDWFTFLAAIAGAGSSDSSNQVR